MKNQNCLKWVAGPRTPEKVYITRVLNFGTWEEWCALRRRFSMSRIKMVLKNPLRGQWTSRGRRFAEVLFDCTLPQNTLISYDA